MDDFSSKEFKESIRKDGSELFRERDFPPRLYDTLDCIEAYRKTRLDSASSCIIFEKNALSHIDIDEIGKTLNEKVTTALQLSNQVVIGKNFEVIAKSRTAYQNSSIARQAYQELSLSNDIVFYISKEGTQTFVNGKDIGENRFFTDADLKSYQKKKDLSDLDKVLHEYKVRLKNEATYRNFFVSKTCLVRLFGEKDYKLSKNLLKNKPEKLFRDDLKDYLQREIRGTFNFNKEVVLDSEDRLDINTEDEDGNYYFLEIKWMGISIHQDDTKRGTEYGDGHIKARGISQTLNYIGELKEEKKTVKVGWLTIFDARQDKTNLDFSDLSHIDATLLRHKEAFAIHNLPVDNIIPS